MAPRSESVCLLLADLSGYTAYLVASEPERAPTIVADLVETVVRGLRSQLRLVKLEGDAAFMVAPLEGTSGSRLIDALADTVARFDRRLQSLVGATTCACGACRGIPALDLKFIIHAGKVVRQRMAGRVELTGTDVVIAHRLLKADAPRRAGVPRYAMFSGSAVQALALQREVRGMVHAVERFEHLGAVDVYLLDMNGASAGPSSVSPPRRRPLAESDLVIDLSPSDTWDRLTQPRERVHREGPDRIEEASDGPSQGPGTVTACVIDDLSMVEEILDWQPSRRLVRRTRLPSRAVVTSWYVLEPVGTGTALHVRWYGSAAAGPHVARERSRIEAWRASSVAAVRVPRGEVDVAHR